MRQRRIEAKGTKENFDGMNTINWIGNKRGPKQILLIRLILSRPLEGILGSAGGLARKIISLRLSFAGRRLAVSQNTLCRAMHVIHGRGSCQLFRVSAFLFRPVSRPDKDALFDSGVPAAFQITQLVPDHVTLLEVDAEFVAGVEEELRRRFASTAGLLGRFGRDV